MAAALAAAVLTTGLAAAPSSATHGEPNINYVSLKKSKQAPKAKRYTLRLFTSYAHRGYSISALYGSEVGARYAGRNNRTFEEWHISKRSPGDAKKLIRRLVSKLKRKGSVRFGAHLQTPGATAPKSYQCKLTGFNNLGGCAGVAVPLVDR